LPFACSRIYRAWQQFVVITVTSVTERFGRGEQGCHTIEINLAETAMIEATNRHKPANDLLTDEALQSANGGSAFTDTVENSRYYISALFHSHWGPPYPPKGNHGH
jgi:hypothetical protein